MQVNMTLEDVWIFRRYLEEHGHDIPESCPYSHIIRKMAKAIRVTLKDPPIVY
jgi:hypothetical protein